MVGALNSLILLLWQLSTPYFRSVFSLINFCSIVVFSTTLQHCSSSRSRGWLVWFIKSAFTISVTSLHLFIFLIYNLILYCCIVLIRICAILFILRQQQNHGSEHQALHILSFACYWSLILETCYIYIQFFS